MVYPEPSWGSTYRYDLEPVTDRAELLLNDVDTCLSEHKVPLG